MGSLIAAPILGFLSDKLGRWPVMVSGLVIFISGTTICIYAPSLSCFLTGRFFQGFGAIVAPVVGWAIIQDIYSIDEADKIMSWVGSVLSAGPFFAPGLGGYIHVFFGWQGNFIFIFLMTAITLILIALLYPKGEKIKRAEKTSFLKTLKMYVRIITDKTFLYYISLFAFLACGEWCYLTLAPFYFENSLMLSPDSLGLYLSGSASMFILGTLLTPFFLNRLGLNKTLKLGIILTLIGSGTLLGISFLASTNVLFIVMAVGLYFLGTAVIWGPSSSRALQRFEDIRGAASGVRILILTSTFAIGGFIGTFLDDSSIIPLSFFLLTMAIACWIVLQGVVKLEVRE
jgi:DHA1 family bicyclomycin/chloramphenicol resistance-like MFS transporter